MHFAPQPPTLTLADPNLLPSLPPHRLVPVSYAKSDAPSTSEGTQSRSGGRFCRDSVEIPIPVWQPANQDTPFLVRGSGSQPPLRLYAFSPTPRTSAGSVKLLRTESNGSLSTLSNTPPKRPSQSQFFKYAGADAAEGLGLTRGDIVQEGWHGGGGMGDRWDHPEAPSYVPYCEQQSLESPAVPVTRPGPRGLPSSGADVTHGSGCGDSGGGFRTYEEACTQEQRLREWHQPWHGVPLHKCDGEPHLTVRPLGIVVGEARWAHPLVKVPDAALEEVLLSSDGFALTPKSRVAAAAVAASTDLGTSEQSVTELAAAAALMAMAAGAAPGKAIDLEPIWKHRSGDLGVKRKTLANAAVAGGSAINGVQKGYGGLGEQAEAMASDIVRGDATEPSSTITLPTSPSLPDGRFRLVFAQHYHHQHQHLTQDSEKPRFLNQPQLLQDGSGATTDGMAHRHLKLYPLMPCTTGIHQAHQAKVARCSDWMTSEAEAGWNTPDPWVPRDTLSVTAAMVAATESITDRTGDSGGLAAAHRMVRYRRVDETILRDSEEMEIGRDGGDEGDVYGYEYGYGQIRGPQPTLAHSVSHVMASTSGPPPPQQSQLYDANGRVSSLRNPTYQRGSPFLQVPLGSTVVQAMACPMWGTPHDPDHTRVDEGSGRAHGREALGPVEVTCGTTEDLYEDNAPHCLSGHLRRNLIVLPEGHGLKLIALAGWEPMGRKRARESCEMPISAPEEDASGSADDCVEVWVHNAEVEQEGCATGRGQPEPTRAIPLSQ